MTTYRVKKDSGFFSIQNKIVIDTDLNDEAFRLYCYLMSNSDDWTVFNGDIMKKLKWTEHKLDKAVKSLKENGFLERTQKHEEGRWKWETNIYENPQKHLINQITIGRISTPCISTPCKTPDITKNNFKQKLNKTNTKTLLSKFSVEEELQKEEYQTLTREIKEKFTHWFSNKNGKRTEASFKLSINQILQATTQQQDWLLTAAIKSQTNGKGWQGIELEYLPTWLKNQPKAKEQPKLIKIGAGKTFVYDWEMQEILDCFNEHKIDLNYLQDYLKTNYTELEAENPNLIKLNQYIK